ncbi:MAG: polysaccharide biosynthesis tyrosine autokinase [Phycisphaerales bacterium]|nr:MAG: polysaccharide biosynthesis tyrosine autokinase [Phycisphaerales bacterium]
MKGVLENNLPEQQEVPPAEMLEGFSEGLFEILWRRRWTVLLATLVTMTGGFVYLQRATPLYTSTSRLYVEQTGIQGLERDSSGIVSRWTNYLYTQAELLRRTETLSQALKSPAMGQLKTFAEASNPIVALRKGLDVQVGKKDEIINVSLTSPYPEEAANIVNTVVDAYITAHNERKRDTSAEVVRILKDERARRDEELNEKLQTMTQFELENEALAFGTERQNNIIVSRLTRLEAALTEAQLATIEAKSFYAAIQKMAEDAEGMRQFVEAQRSRGVYIAATGEAARLRAELQQLERNRADCLQRLKPDTPAIAALDAKMARVREQIQEVNEQFATSQLVVAQEQYLAAQEQEKELQAHFTQQREAAIELNNSLVQYGLLKSEYEQTKKFCDILDDRIRVLNVDPQVGSLNVEIVEAASPPIEPSAPQKARTMGLALCLGLFAGVGLGLLREWRDHRLRSTQEISTLLGLPILGVVPSMVWPKQTPAIRGQKVRVSPDSREAEAFRTIRTAVFFGVPKEEAKTIVITSPAPNEGKSTVASNLAIAMAQAGQRVIVVDADFRRPTQHKIFDVDPHAKGISLVLAAEMRLADAIECTRVRNLNVLTGGPTVLNPAETLDSNHFARILKALRTHYDRVIIDSPPVVAVTDSQILAARCDVTILVLRAQVSSRRISLQARENMVGVHARLLGVVVNDVPRKSDRYGYYGGYGYYNYSSQGNGGNGGSAPKRAVPSTRATHPSAERLEPRLSQ